MDQTPTLNLNLCPQGKFAELCLGFVDDLARWEAVNQPRACALKKQDQLSREATCKVLLAHLYQTAKRETSAAVGVLVVINYYSKQKAKVGPNVTYQSVMILLDFFTSRNLIEIVLEGRKHPDAKHGIPTQKRARQGLIDYLDQEDIGPADLRMEWPTIILKAGKADGKRRLNFDQTEQTRALEAIGEAIFSD